MMTVQIPHSKLYRNELPLNLQAANEFCRNAARQLGQCGTECLHYKDGVLVRHTPIGTDLQKLVPQTIRKRLLNLSHLPLPSGHPEKLCMYDSIPSDYYCLNKSCNVRKTTSSCHNFAKSGTIFENKRNLQPFHATRPLDSAAEDILGPKSDTKNAARTWRQLQKGTRNWNNLGILL